MHVCLDLGDRLLMGDSPSGYFETPQGFCVQISIQEPAEAERIFHALAENGQVKMPFCSRHSRKWCANYPDIKDKGLLIFSAKPRIPRSLCS